MSTRSENDALGCTCHVSRSTVTPPSERARRSTTAGTGSAVSKRNSQPSLIRTSVRSCGSRETPDSTALEEPFESLLAQGPVAQDDSAQIAVTFTSFGLRAVGFNASCRSVNQEHDREARPQSAIVGCSPAASLARGPKPPTGHWPPGMRLKPGQRANPSQTLSPSPSRRPRPSRGPPCRIWVHSTRPLPPRAPPSVWHASRA
jgi:hypothetical protein